ncbi:hypothetical protein KCU81_g840, partial [Aureobasidium melanogenum]
MPNVKVVDRKSERVGTEAGLTRRESTAFSGYVSNSGDDHWGDRAGLRESRQLSWQFWDSNSKVGLASGHRLLAHIGLIMISAEKVENDERVVVARKERDVGRGAASTRKAG